MRMPTCSSSTSPRAWWCTRRPATPTARWSTRCSTTAPGSFPALAAPSARASCTASTKTPAACWWWPKNDAAQHQALSEQMRVHSIHRVYHAVVYGNLKEDTGAVETYLGPRPARPQKDGGGTADCGRGTLCLYRLAGVGAVWKLYLHRPAASRPGAPTRSGCTWRRWGTRWAGDAVYGPRSCIQKLAASACTPKNWGFTTRPAAPGCSLTRRCRPYFTAFLDRLRKERGI